MLPIWYNIEKSALDPVRSRKKDRKEWHRPFVSKKNIDEATFLLLNLKIFWNLVIR